MPFPDGAFSLVAWTLQPGGTLFDPPAKIEYPNINGLSPGAIANFMSFDHDIENWAIVSTGHVTDDGASIESDPDSGISKAGWGGSCPPYSTTETVESECDEPGATDWEWTVDRKPQQIESGSVEPAHIYACTGSIIPEPMVTLPSYDQGKATGKREVNCEPDTTTRNIVFRTGYCSGFLARQLYSLLTREPRAT